MGRQDYGSGAVRARVGWSKKLQGLGDTYRGQVLLGGSQVQAAIVRRIHIIRTPAWRSRMHAQRAGAT